MSVRKDFVTKSGVTLPLMNLRGKEYLQVAHRLVWLVEEVKSYSINTEFLKLEDTYAICRTTVKFFDEAGRVIREASATKKETQKDFADFVEKVETGSLGRALAMLGMGTQFSTQDLEEGQRLADAPLSPPGEQAKADAYQIKDSKKEASQNANKPSEPETHASNVAVEKRSDVASPAPRKGFARKDISQDVKPAATKNSSNDDWQ